MRKTPNYLIEHYRAIHPLLGDSMPGQNWGCFRIVRPGGEVLRVVASDGTEAADEGWEHVSVSLVDRVPTWAEMTLVKDLFWGGNETVVQFHPRTDCYINHHPHCLHLWKRRGQAYELPPAKLIGPKKVTESGD